MTNCLVLANFINFTAKNRDKMTCLKNKFNYSIQV
jgi:hypothetical protein